MLTIEQAVRALLYSLIAVPIGVGLPIGLIAFFSAGGSMGEFFGKGTVYTLYYLIFALLPLFVVGVPGLILLSKVKGLNLITIISLALIVVAVVSALVTVLIPEILSILAMLMIPGVFTAVLGAVIVWRKLRAQGALTSQASRDALPRAPA